MGLTDFWIHNYRSIRNVWLKLDRLNVIVGPNGSGKSNLYRAIYLVSSAASGRLARNIAEEGGVASSMWSGEYGNKDKRQVQLSVKMKDLQYDLAFARVPPIMLPDGSLFDDDIEIKKEELFLQKGDSKSRIMHRGRSEVKVRDVKGVMTDYTMRIPINESILSGLREPHKYPQLSALRQELLSWRFYHHFRTDRESPLRRPQFPVFTPIMAHDGSDFVSAMQTIIESGDRGGFFDSLDDAFPGAAVKISKTNTGLRLFMEFPDLRRLLEARELSDGTLQYLCLLTAFYSLDPPSVLVVNEPETSIHPDLFEPLARLLVAASHKSQIWITTHSRDLSDYIVELSGYSPIELEKVAGETKLVGVGLGGYREPMQDEED